METQDLILRKGVFDDWRDLLRNVKSHEESARYMLWNPIYDEKSARENMEKTMKFQKTHDAWLICEKGSNQAIGWAGVSEMKENVWQDTGIAIGPDFTGRGYGKQVLQCLIQYVFQEKRAEKFICSCRSQNNASRSLIQSLGFVPFKAENKTDSRNGEKYILEYYELLCKNF